MKKIQLLWSKVMSPRHGNKGTGDNKSGEVLYIGSQVATEGSQDNNIGRATERAAPISSKKCEECRYRKEIGESNEWVGETDEGDGKVGGPSLQHHCPPTLDVSHEDSSQTHSLQPEMTSLPNTLYIGPRGCQINPAFKLSPTNEAPEITASIKTLSSSSDSGGENMSDAFGQNSDDALSHTTNEEEGPSMKSPENGCEAYVKNEVMSDSLTIDVEGHNCISPKALPSRDDAKFDKEQNIQADSTTHSLNQVNTNPGQPRRKQVLAPPLNDTAQYHVFFLYHSSDRDWVLNVVEKLESPTLGFKCCCSERDISANLSPTQGILYGVKNSLKTILVVSPEFLRFTWSCCEVIVSEVDMISLQKEFVVLMLQECDLPSAISEITYVKTNKHGWWTMFLARIALPDDTPMTEETVLSMSSSLVGLTPGLQSGHLLTSLKSQCGCWGREAVDPNEVPDELLAHGIQIPSDDYSEALLQLMREPKFGCHMWCYNMPLAILFFTVFLGLCLALIPIIEAHVLFDGSQLGMEYLHGAVVWLCVLTIYMFMNHISRRKMKQGMYQKLAKVNNTFIRYNILAGVENLGVADCNKYYLHFFYYELGPCLAYLQELLSNMEEYRPSFTNQVLEADNDGTMELAIDIEDNVDDERNNCDHVTVLNCSNITNISMQNQAEDLLLDHSGEYIYRLITKKLDRPRKQRHVKGAFCLCQYVEHRVYKMLV